MKRFLIRRRHTEFCGSVDLDRALAEEYRRIQPRWAPDGADVEQCHARIHRLDADERPTALCLSGGGIRSATFGLGVLQAFARSGRLQRFDYLSTVSGGGYIGSWLIAWLRHVGGDWGRVNAALADGIAPQEVAPPQRRAEADPAVLDPVGRLRAYSNFLSPVWGLSADTMSLAAIFVRNLLLNLLVWLPLLAAVTLLPRLFLAALMLEPGRAVAGWTAILAALGVVIGIAFATADLPSPRVDADGQPLPPDPETKNRYAVACFAPLLLAAMAFGLAGVWYGPLDGESQWVFVLGGVAVHLLGIAFGVPWRRLRQLHRRTGAKCLFGGLLVVGIGALGGQLLWSALQFPVRTLGRDGIDPLLYAMGSVPVLLGCFWLAMSLHAGAMRRLSSEDEREWWSRATGGWLFASGIWVLLFGLTVQFPLWLFDRFGAALPDGVQLGLGGTALGVATALMGYWSQNGATLKRKAETLLKATGLRLLDAMAAGVIVVLVLMLSLSASWSLERCHDLGETLCREPLQAQTDHLRQQALLDRMAKPAANPPRNDEAQAFEHVLLHADGRGLLVAVLGLAGFALGVSALIGTNAFSLHGMYGNRLVRAYLGAPRDERHPHWFTGFDPDDNLGLDDRDPSAPGRPPIRPFHVVNIAMNLVSPSSRRLAWQQRKAASFTATPLHCGTADLGYVPSSAYGGRHGMSLGRALTISGAAASPNMGYHSSALVTFVMALFNVRLGWWLPNPSAAHARQWHRDEPRVAFKAMLDEAFGRTTDDRASVYLSDGGHFENLGLYEMVRRRCHRIVVVDATCDPKFEYADLHDSVRKIRVDLGIPVELPATLPGPDHDQVHPRLVVGRIRYSARDGIAPEQDGWLYLIKPRLVAGDPLPQLAHYAAGPGGGDSPFPHQSTADQFYDETQFESYRLLGMLSAEACFPAERDAVEGSGSPRLNWPSSPPPFDAPRAAARAESAHPCQPCQAASGAGGLMSGLQHLGGGAALASALTVGGTLGVVGTLSVAPGEVRLSAEDRALLKEGLSVKLAGGELVQGLKVDISGRIDASELKGLAEPARQTLDALRQAGDRLASAADRLRAGEPDRELKLAIDALRAAIGTLKPGTGDPAVSKLTERLSELVVRLENPAPPLDLKPLRDDIKAVTEALKGLKDSVDAASPRRNVRGQEGAAR